MRETSWEAANWTCEISFSAYRPPSVSTLPPTYFFFFKGLHQVAEQKQLVANGEVLLQ